jgi:type II secretory pathway pseudopilin PulG
MTHTQTRRRRRAGFTLIESLVAGGIFALSLAAVAVMITESARASSAGNLNIEMSQIAKEIIQEYSGAGAAGVGLSYGPTTRTLASGIQVDVSVTVQAVNTVGPNTLVYTTQLVTVLVQKGRQTYRAQAYANP